MFKRATLFSLLGLCLVSFLWIGQLTFVRKSDIAKIVSQLKKKNVAETKAPVAADQKRHGVRKEIWFTQDDKSRLHFRIDSKASTLTLLPQDDKVDMIENLEGVRCWMQDKLYTSESGPMQQLRYFEAETGTYHLAAQQFLAQTVHLSLFRIPGTALPINLDSQKAFLHGIASDVSFSVAGKSPQFHAERFRANLKPQEASP
ncbi:MAG: hypothetical protein JSR58_00230 [Verrucomicrobia bacterium]|nr:hypothetical protein [Verrucomicrobiota bacterium]